MDFNFLSETILFRGTTVNEIEIMLGCLGSFTKNYQKGDVIYRNGERTRHLGLVLSGSVNIENDDVWGNKNILNNVQAGKIFAESYACASITPLTVTVISAEKSSILFLDVNRILCTCPSSCSHHTKLIHNLLLEMAQKNLSLSQKIFHTAPKSIQGRLLSYLSQQALEQGCQEFEIPFNRQQLADYLNVERSALSKELSKMKAEQILDYEKSRFILYLPNK